MKRRTYTSPAIKGLEMCDQLVLIHYYMHPEHTRLDTIWIQVTANMILMARETSASIFCSRNDSIYY